VTDPDARATPGWRRPAGSRCVLVPLTAPQMRNLAAKLRAHRDTLKGRDARRKWARKAAKWDKMASEKERE
jgi:hypothetical protein